MRLELGLLGSRVETNGKSRVDGTLVLAWHGYGIVVRAPQFGVGCGWNGGDQVDGVCCHCHRCVALPSFFWSDGRSFRTSGNSTSLGQRCYRDPGFMDCLGC